MNDNALPKPFVFVLMPFDSSFDDTYKLGIKPACVEAGYYCERLDEQIYDDSMFDRIRNQIAKADLIVADLSERNPNVFYETGYAHALGKRVIPLTKDANDIPFDLTQHSHIVYAGKIAFLKDELFKRASYFISHPSAPSRDPFSQTELLLNGQQVDWNAQATILNIRIEGVAPISPFMPINCAFHLKEDAIDREIDIEVRLITPNVFPESGWRSPGSRQIYSTVTMPNDLVMHKPFRSVRIGAGDPDQMRFELDRPAGFGTGNVYPMILRLFSRGLKRDLKINCVA